MTSSDNNIRALRITANLDILYIEISSYKKEKASVHGKINIEGNIVTH